jgi:hypothetical protein
MRLAGFWTLFLFISPALAANNSDIFHECIGLVRAAESAKEIAGIRCLGYIEALVPGLRTIHNHYETAFPNLRFPIADQPTA